MRITDALLGEHGVLYALFDHLEADLDDGADPVAHARLLRAVLHGHARTENALLFEEMASRMNGPGDAMLREHEEVADLLARTETADGEELSDLLRDVMDLARRHFRREEEAAFPAAEDLLQPARLRALGAEWGVRRDVRLSGSHERY